MVQKFNELRRLVQRFKCWQKMKDGKSYFFFLALVGYYNSIFRINTTVGHLVYRLSDTIDFFERQQIEVCEGSLFYDIDWDSLEGWRKRWEKHFPKGIPEIFELTSDIDDGKELEEDFIQLAK